MPTEPVILVRHQKPIKQRRVRRPMNRHQFFALACLVLALARYLTTYH